jgi:hypothetical protein
MIRRLTMVIAVLGASLTACGGPEPDAFTVQPWDGTRVATVCVESTEDYGFGRNAATPLRDGLSAVFAEGVVVSADCDATIRIEATGHARSARYDRPDPARPGSTSSECYTGASVRGTMSLHADGHPSLTEAFDWTQFPPSSIPAALGCPTERGAPYWQTARFDVLWILDKWFGTTESAALERLVPLWFEYER